MTSPRRWQRGSKPFSTADSRRNRCGNESAAKAFAHVSKFRAFTSASRKHAMDVEHINAIGNHLADLSKRTVDLRGYL